MTALDIAWYVALGGWLVALVQAIAGHLERRHKQRQDLLLTALSYLTGGTQKRSVGIAIIEGMWKHRPQFEEVVIPAFTNQAVYLLLHSRQKNSRHEIHNWLRMIGLLLRHKDLLRRYGQSYEELGNAMYIKIGPERGSGGGIGLTTGTIESWYKDFEFGDSSWEAYRDEEDGTKVSGVERPDEENN